MGSSGAAIQFCIQVVQQLFEWIPTTTAQAVLHGIVDTHAAHLHPDRVLVVQAAVQVGGELGRVYELPQRLQAGQVSLKHTQSDLRKAAAQPVQRERTVVIEH